MSRHLVSSRISMTRLVAATGPYTHVHRDEPTAGALSGVPALVPWGLNPRVEPTVTFTRPGPQPSGLTPPAPRRRQRRRGQGVGHQPLIVGEEGAGQVL